MKRSELDNIYKRLSSITQTEEPQNSPISSNQSPHIQTNLEQGLESIKDTNQYQKTKNDRDFRLDTAQVYENLLKRKIAYLTSQITKYSYIVHIPGHKNSSNESAPWVIKKHETDEILSSHKTEEAAKKHLQQMHAHK